MSIIKVDESGIQTGSLLDIKADIEARQRASLGDGINQSSESVLGQINSVIAETVAQVTEGVLASYMASRMGSATGQPLIDLVELNDTQWRAATRGFVEVLLDLEPGTIVPALAEAYVLGDETMRYRLRAETTNVTQVRAMIPAIMDAAELGSRTRANSGTLTEIATSIVGWEGVTNPADSVPGLDNETWEELRARNTRELSRGGSATAGAIYVAISDVPGVVSVRVEENKMSSATATGQPPHSIFCVVGGGDRQAIANAIYNKAAGINTHGAISENVVDARGEPVAILFSRPTNVLISVRVTVEIDERYQGPTSIREAIADYGRTVGVGNPVLIARLYQPTFTVTGIVNVTNIEIARGAAPFGSVDLSMNPDELPTFDTSRVTVVIA